MIGYFSNISDDIKHQFLLRNSEPLNDGEIVLLARAISDYIPVSCDMQAKDLVLLYKYSIEEILNFISQFSFITDEQRKVIYSAIEGFLSWRISLIYNPKDILFLSGENYLVDEMSLITQYVDAGLLCSVCNIYSKANYTYLLFKKLAKEIGVKSNGS